MGLNLLRFENRKPNPPLCLWCFGLPKPQPAGRNRRIGAAKAAANRKIAGHKATKKVSRGVSAQQGSFLLIFFIAEEVAVR